MRLSSYLSACLIWNVCLDAAGCSRIANKSSHVRDRNAYGGNKLLLLMLDGFRPDYVPNGGKEKYPNFHKLFFDGGAVVDYVQPIFPSVSFPSWTTIGTGKHMLQVPWEE